MVLSRSLNPASLEQGAELRLWARSPGCCQSAAAAWIQHGNAALAAAALMRGMEKKKKSSFSILALQRVEAWGKGVIVLPLAWQGKEVSWATAS